MFLHHAKTSTLLRLGLAILALRGLLQYLVDSTGHSTNITDFALGVVFGVGAGLTMLAIWRNGRGPRGQSSCAE
jgi:hypothetical protein